MKKLQPEQLVGRKFTAALVPHLLGRTVTFINIYNNLQMVSPDKMERLVFDGMSAEIQKSYVWEKSRLFSSNQKATLLLLLNGDVDRHIVEVL